MPDAVRREVCNAEKVAEAEAGQYEEVDAAEVGRSAVALDDGVAARFVAREQDEVQHGCGGDGDKPAAGVCQCHRILVEQQGEEEQRQVGQRALCRLAPAQVSGDGEDGNGEVDCPGSTGRRKGSKQWCGVGYPDEGAAAGDEQQPAALVAQGVGGVAALLQPGGGEGDECGDGERHVFSGSKCQGEKGTTCHHEGNESAIDASRRVAVAAFFFAVELLDEGEQGGSRGNEDGGPGGRQDAEWQDEGGSVGENGEEALDGSVSRVVGITGIVPPAEDVGGTARDDDDEGGVDGAADEGLGVRGDAVFAQQQDEGDGTDVDGECGVAESADAAAHADVVGNGGFDEPHGKRPACRQEEERQGKDGDGNGDDVDEEFGRFTPVAVTGVMPPTEDVQAAAEGNGQGDGDGSGEQGRAAWREVVGTAKEQADNAAKVGDAGAVAEGIVPAVEGEVVEEGSFDEPHGIGPGGRQQQVRQGHRGTESEDGTSGGEVFFPVGAVFAAVAPPGELDGDAAEQGEDGWV